MMIKRFTQITLMALAMMILVGEVALSQNFTNNAGGTYTAECEAVIKIKSASGVFDGGAILGEPGAPIAGTVDWAATAPQIVQARDYTNLFMSGGTKSVQGGVVLWGNGCASPLPDYLALDVTNFVGFFATSDARTYAGVFEYAGLATQKIFAEGTAGGTYQDLVLSGTGQKLIVSGEDVSLDGDFTMEASNTGGLDVAGTLAAGINMEQDAAAPITIDGGSVTTGSGTNDFAGSIGITADGDLFNSISAGNNYSGAVNVADGSFNIDAAGTNTSIEAAGSLTLSALAGEINMTNESDLNIAGAFVNSIPAGGRTNMNFSAASTVTYAGAGAQGLVAADATNKYGNLVFTGAGTKTADGDNYVQDGSTVAVAGGPIDMTTGPYVFDVDVTSGNSISYASPDNDEYIRGSVRLSGTLDPAETYVMNNAQTQVGFLTVPTDFTLDVLPQTAPDLTNNFNAATDVNRRVTLGFTGGPAALDLLRVGYTSLDVAPTVVEDDLRFAEGYNASQDYQKITGGSGVATNGGAADPRFVDLASTGGIDLIAAGPGTTQEIGDASQIILTSTPLIYIADTDGRWTNPNTWDEGAVPPTNSNTEIHALVYVGIKGPAFGTDSTGNTIPEITHYGNNVVATNSIKIVAGDNHALIIGNEDNGAGYLFHTALSGQLAGINAGFVNENAGTVSGDWDNKNIDPNTNTLYGLWVQQLEGLNINVPAFGTAQILNTGAIRNGALIELGQ